MYIIQITRMNSPLPVTNDWFLQDARFVGPGNTLLGIVLT